jgi:uncharacterized protein (TIGR03435 family)
MDSGSIRHVVLVTIAALAVAHRPLLAQTAATPAASPAYEVASIHQNMNPDPRWNLYFTPDGVHATDVTLSWVLHEAYGMSDSDRWSGGPAWLDKARFDIEAKYDVSKYPNLTREQRHAMLQQLLADRFKVVVHHEVKEFPLYALVVSKGGPKFEETKPEDLMKSKMDGAVMCMVTGGRKGTIEMHGCTTTQFAFDLSGYGRLDIGRKVVDQTGLSGHYTFALHWAPVETSIQSSTAPDAPEPSGPSIFTAIREQLGLELKPIKGPLDTIVIDNAEMPTEN